jgi:hypothetical protein
MHRYGPRQSWNVQMSASLCARLLWTVQVPVAVIVPAKSMYSPVRRYQKNRRHVRQGECERREISLVPYEIALGKAFMGVKY